MKKKCDQKIRDLAKNGVALFLIGEIPPPPYCDIKDISGAIFNPMDSGGAIICVYMDNITEEEILDFENGLIETGYISVNSFWMGMVKIGDNIHELRFNPMLFWESYGYFQKDIFSEKSIVNMILVESTDMTLKAHRVLFYTNEFIDSLHFAYKNFTLDETYSERYDLFLNELRRHTVLYLWAMCEKSGCFPDFI